MLSLGGGIEKLTFGHPTFVPINTVDLDGVHPPKGAHWMACPMILPVLFISVSLIPNAVADTSQKCHTYSGRQEGRY